MEQVRLEVAGLWLDPNELTTPPGAMREALNVRIRRVNTLEPRPGFPLTDIAGASGGGRAVFTWDGEVYAVFGTELWKCNGTPAEVLAGASSLAISSDTAFMSPMGRCGYAVTDGGVYRIATPGSSTAVLAGVATGGSALVTAVAGSLVPNGEHVSFRTAFTDTVNNQLLIGAPSAPFTYANSSGSGKGVSLRVALPSTVTAGMVVQVYRTNVVAVATPTGDEMALATAQTITAGNVTAGYVDVVMTTAAGLGASLYTNETQEGILQAAYPPPKAKCIAWWKNMAFYGDTSLVDAYYLFGQTRSSGADPIGYTSLLDVGDTTIGSPVVLNVGQASLFTIGMYVSSTDLASQAGTFQANTRVIAVGATSITLDKSALANTLIGSIRGFSVLTVDGVEFINGSASDTANKQFGSRSDLVSLVEANTDVSLFISDNDTLDYTMTWTAPTSFSVTYTTVPNRTLVGLYSNTPTAAGLSSAEATPSRVAWSKTLQPEAVPLLQYQDIGDWRAPVMRLLPTRDSLFVLKSDGVWRITGDSPDTLRVEEFDRTVKLIHRRAADINENQVWAWTQNGVVSMSEAGVQRISEPSIGVALAASQENIITLGLDAPPGGCFITGCTNQECVLVGVPSSTATGASASAEYVYVWESKTSAWVRWQPLANVDWRGAVEHTGTMLLVGDDSSLMYQDEDRTDAETAVTVSLASSTQATIAALGSTGVGHRVTQGAVESWLTESLGSAAYTTTAALANGAATTAFPMTCEVEWNAAPTSGALVHWRQIRAQFSEFVQVWRLLFGFTSERVHTEGTVYADFDDPTAEKGVSAQRMFITRAQSRAARLRVILRIASAGQKWLLNGITLTGSPMNSGDRLP